MKYLLLLVILFIPCLAEQTITIDGKRITIMDDGTWKQDSTLPTPPTIPTIALKDTCCDSLTMTVVDQIEGKSYKAASGPIIISDDNEEGMVISILKPASGAVVLSIKCFGAGPCVDRGDKIHVLFSDNTRLELKAGGKFNCDAPSTVYFRGVFGNESALKELTSKKVQALRVWTGDSFIEQALTMDMATKLQYTLKCMAN
jgi:hypothetical protein